MLVNSDGDPLAKTPTGFESADLCELEDEWGNPIAYFHHRDYGRDDAYVTQRREGRGDPDHRPGPQEPTDQALLQPASASS